MNGDSEKLFIQYSAVMPNGARAPTVMTLKELIVFLRLDEMNLKFPEETIRRYRTMGLLKGTQVSRQVLFTQIEVLRFLDRLTTRNPR